MFFSRRYKFEKQFINLCHALSAKEWREHGSIYKRLTSDFPEFTTEINALERCAGYIFHEAIMNYEYMSIDSDTIVPKLVSDKVSEKMATWAFIKWKQVLKRDAHKMLDIAKQVRTATMRAQYSHIEQLVGPSIARALAARKKEEEEEENRIRIEEENEKIAVRQWCLLNPERVSSIEEKARRQVEKGDMVTLGLWGVSPKDIDQYLVDELVHELVIEIIHEEEK